MVRLIPPPRGLSIARIAGFVAGILAFSMLALFAFGLTLVKDMRDVSNRWRVYEVEAATKTDALSELRGLIGLGGVIDHFHEYQLMGDQPHRDLLQESLRLTRANLDVYRSVGPTTPLEDQAIANIAHALDALEAKLPEVAAGHAQGQSPLAVIHATTIDLSAAAEALKMLNTELSRSSSELTEANIEGLAHLHKFMIVGGSLGMALMLGVASIIVWTARRRVIAPLARLVNDSRRLAALDLDHPYHWPRNDELGELGRTLDNTRQTLRDLLTENEEKTKRLSHQATHDHLTGLPNRALLVHWLRERLGKPLTLLFLDLDGFKMINDSLGHGVGDKLLIAVGQRLTHTLVTAGLVVRLGGDEFVVVVDGGERQAATDCASRIERAFARPFPINGMELNVATSIGIAMNDGNATQPDDLLRDADIALYRAKEAGRGKTEIFDVALREAVQIRHRLQRDLDRALQNQDIFVVYQPIMQLSSGQIMGFEALIRWRHPDLGLINPVQFVPIAEEMGTILELGRYVLEQAAHDMARFRKTGTRNEELTVNVNFSPRQMWDDTHVTEVMSCLARPEFSGIKIEVTESLAMTNPEAARDILMRFRDLGVKLCIDDFGTGYSSLSYLGRFPFNVLKLDKSFIADLTGGNDGQMRLVRGVINLAHDLGLEVVAEGIETAAELEKLQRFGCDLGQGYLIAKPMSAENAQIFLLNHVPIRPELVQDSAEATKTPPLV